MRQTVSLAPIAAAVAIAISSVAVQATAAPTAAEKKEAAALQKDGDALRKKGDLAAALEKYKRAHEILYTPITGLQLGRAYLDLGRLLEAREAFLDVARIDKAPKEDAKTTKAREEAQLLADDLAVRIPVLRIKLARVPKGATPIVRVDGSSVPESALALPRKVDPGKHVVTVTAGGFGQTIELQLEERETREVVVELGPPDPPPAAEPPRPPPPSPPHTASLSPLVYGGFGALGVGLVAGGIAGVVAMSKASALRDACVEGRCPRTAESDLSGARTAATVSTLSFAVAGVGLGVAIVGLVLAPSNEPPPKASAHVSPLVGLGFAGVLGEF